MQDQFLNVIDRDEAERRFRAALTLAPLGEETVGLAEALGRVLAADVTARFDVPSFDRSNYDGFAVRAADTYGAQEESPRRLRLLKEVISTGMAPQSEVVEQTAAAIATGGMMPRGADAVVMVEHADVEAGETLVRKAVTPGFGVSFAGSDIALGETVLRRGDLLTSRETGVLAAIGQTEARAWRRPRVAVISTGDEIIEPGETMHPGLVFDSNARILADAVRELGGEPHVLGIVRDDADELRRRVHAALESCDVVLLSGGTSKGAGDISYRVVRELTDPGIVAHGVALKPGKPICLAATQGKPVVVLPGFPTSAVFTFHEFVAPVIAKLAGRGVEQRSVTPARLAVKVNSQIGRTEYLLVGLVATSSPQPPDGTTSRSRPPDGTSAQNAASAPTEPFVAEEGSAETRTASGSARETSGDPGPVRRPGPTFTAYPMGKGSGSVTAFSRADGFVTIGRHEEIVEAGALVEVQLLGRELRLAELVVIGSHCLGLDYLLGEVQQRGFQTKFLAVGSLGGLAAAQRGECDLAGIHLLDEATGQYNRPFLTPELELIEGYGRLQGVVFRRDDERFARWSGDPEGARKAIAAVKDDPQCVMVNRNSGSGTRILIDRLLSGAQPRGYAVQPRSHNAVAAAVLQRRADWGVAIRSAAEQADLGFLPLTEERYDFVVPKARLDRPAVRAFRELLADPKTKESLRARGFLIGAAS